MKGSSGEASERIHRQLDALEAQSASPKPIRTQQFAEIVHSLRSALEEVEAVEAELSQQNEELLNAREALEVERHRFKDLFELAPDGFLITDGHSVIEEANEAASRLLNAPAKGLRGKPLLVFVDLPERPAFRTRLGQLRAGQTLADLEMSLRAREIGPRPCLVTVVRDEDKPGKPPRLFWILRDLSERQAAAQALRESEERLRHSQRLEAIGRLAGGIAHSFNNLLAAIGFHAELILEELPEEAAGSRRHGQEILNAGDRAATLARQLLAFGRKQILQPRVLRINRVIAEMEPMLRRLLGEDVLLEVSLSPEVGTVCVDLGQLEQVILNLAANARDAMPRGGRLQVATSMRELTQEEVWGGEGLPPGEYVALAIHDTGTGMAPETLAQIFEPFFTTKERDKGTGLGLATVYGILRQSGGGIRVESEPGLGSTFTVLLPCAAEAETVGPAEQSVPKRRTEARGSELLLVVEDEDNIREPLVEILESRGYQVLAARDGAEALAVSHRHGGVIHLLITDVIMPGMSGGQLAEQLESSRPGLRVLYISGYPEDSVARQGVLQNGSSFLQKPFPPSELLITVRGVLDAES